MRSPFPGIDPYLEHPELWPDVHNRLINAIADDLGPRIAPKYATRLQRRAFLLRQGDLDLVGIPDVSFLTAVPDYPEPARAPMAGPTVMEVEVPILDEITENYLEIRSGRGAIVTTVEILSPVNKVDPRGRREYSSKRNQIFSSFTNFVEIDFLRSGAPMEVFGPNVRGDYRILISRGFHRPPAHLHVFGLRDPIPQIAIPLMPGDEEPIIDLGAILHAVYERARYDLEIDYSSPAVPSLSAEDATWAGGLVA